MNRLTIAAANGQSLSTKGEGMDSSEIRQLAVKAFGEKYPEDTAVTGTEVVPDAFGGTLAVVRSIEKNGNPNEEMVYVYPDKTVRIFNATEDMAAFLEQKARRPNIVSAMSNISFIAGCVFVFLIFTTFLTGFFPNSYSKDAFAALTGVLGTAAGFFFGSKKV
jgi:hypothetical protein